MVSGLRAIKWFYKYKYIHIYPVVKFLSEKELCEGGVLGGDELVQPPGVGQVILTGGLPVKTVS